MFAHPWALWVGIPALIAYGIIRYRVAKVPAYKSALWSVYRKHTHNRASVWHVRITIMLQFVTLGLLLCALARPRCADESSKVTVQGVATMLVIDASGSMQLFDDVANQRSRFQVAKEQARSYIQARKNDPIGLVIFGAVALSRCPLTFDKHVLLDIVDDLKIGTVNPDGTAFAMALALAANRLKHVQAKEKIIIALTDGTPSEHDIEPQIALDLAQSLGIKIYTIGVGSEQGGYTNHPLYGVVPITTSINFDLLESIAKHTGGVCFRAPKPEDVARVYSTIDSLETTENQMPTYALYHEYWAYFLWAALVVCIFNFSSALWWYKV